MSFFFFQAEDGIRYKLVTGVQTCALPISSCRPRSGPQPRHAGRGRAVGIRRGAALQAPRALEHRGDAARPVRNDGTARRARRPRARRGAASPGGTPPRRGSGVRRCRTPCGAPRDAPAVLRVAARGPGGAAHAGGRGRVPRPLLDGFNFAALADALAALGADAWLVYDFRHVNPVAERILGPTGIGSRRLFVLLPQRGKPVAVAHRIELQPLADFPGEVRPYGSWRELRSEEHTSELQSLAYLVCRLLLEKKKKNKKRTCFPN